MKLTSNIKKIIRMVLSLVSIASICVFAIVTYGSMSLGWFSFNTNSYANNMSVGVQTPEKTEVEVAFYDVNSASGNSITFDLSQETDAELPLYDILDAKTHYVLMEMTAKENCTLTISTNTTYRLDSTRLLLGGDGVGDTYSNWVSSIIFFEEVTLTDGSCTLSAGNTFVDKSTYGFKNTDDTPCTFTYTLTAATPAYIVIGYDEELMSKLYSENIGNPNINNDDIKYVNDCNFAVTLGGEAS